MTTYRGFPYSVSQLHGIPLVPLNGHNSFNQTFTGGHLGYFQILAMTPPPKCSEDTDNISFCTYAILLG